MIRVRQPCRRLFGTVADGGGGGLQQQKPSADGGRLGRWFAFPERFRGTFVERWKLYWESVAKDYYEATAGVGTYARRNPAKSSLAAACAGAAYWCAATNPDARSYRAELLDCANSMLYVSPAVRNPAAVRHLEHMERCYNAGAVRTLDLCFLTVVWVDECDDALRSYRATCEYLKPSVLSVAGRAVDVGFLDVWWSLRRIMVDYDVNPDEWKDYDGPE